MNIEIKEKEISEYSNKEIELFLTSEECIEAGVVLISNNEKKVKLGAMNPIYQKVLLKRPGIRNLGLKIPAIKACFF